MSISAEVTELEGDRVRLDVVVPEDEVRRETDRTLQRLGREVKVPGFRPGKVPASVVLQRVGRAAVVEDMLNHALGHWYAHAVEHTGISPVADPEVELEEVPEDGDLAFTATVQLRPQAKLGEYSGLEVVREEAEVDEESVDAEVERLREQAARLETVERSARSGDYVVIDFEGRRGGKRMRDAAARDYVVQLGAGRLVQGFDDHVAGMSAGEQKTFSITYSPEDQRPTLRGQVVEYDLTVKQVQERVLPEMGDDFVGEVTEFDTLEELRADIRAGLMTRAEAAAEELFRRRAIDAATANAELDVPESMVQQRVIAILRETAGRLPEGVGLEDYLAASGTTLQQAAEQIAPDAELAIRRELVVESIAEAESIAVSDEEVEEQIRSDAEASERSYDDLRADIDRVDGFERLREDMTLRRAVDVIVDGAVPIEAGQAEAREKLWTPDKERGTEEKTLWTPGSGPRQGGAA